MRRGAHCSHHQNTHQDRRASTVDGARVDVVALDVATEPVAGVGTFARFLEYRVRRVACEGGAELFRSLLELHLVDQLNLTIAPYIFGGKTAPTLTGRSFDFLADGSIRCTLREMRVLGGECFLQYRLKYPANA